MKKWNLIPAILVFCGSQFLGFLLLTGCSPSSSSPAPTSSAASSSSEGFVHRAETARSSASITSSSDATASSPLEEHGAPGNSTSKANGLSARSGDSVERQREAIVPAGQTTLPTDDPNASGWAIEPLSVKLDAQLKHLEDLLKAPQSYDANTLAVSDARLDRLRPLERDKSFQLDWLVVERSREQGNSQQTVAEFIGGDGLRKSLGTMLEELGKPRELRGKAKIVGIQLHNESATTEIIYQLFVSDANGTLQVNATWECVWTEIAQTHPRLQQLRVVRYEETRTKTGGAAPFVDLTSQVIGGDAFQQQLQWGVDHWLTRIEERMDIDIAGWQGLALGDVNGDGLDDIYICQPGGLPNRLFLQNADGTAQETSASAGVDWLDATHGALLVDLDNDLDQDLLVSVTSGVLVMSNDGQGRFTLRAAKVMPAAVPYSLGAADYDQDGDLDIYVCCYNRRQNVNYHLLFARPVPYHDANNGGPNVLLENVATPVTGEWQFQYATTRVGLDHNNHRFSYAVAWEDYDNDGDLDLYVANDFGRKNLYRNDHGHFRDVAPEARVEDIGPGMSACWGDYNNDGWMDLYVSNMFSSAGNRITEQSRFQSHANEATREAFRRHARGNTLFANRGDGTFEDVSVQAGVVLGRWAWGSRFVDLNNDGWQDLVVANGFITQADTDDL